MSTNGKLDLKDLTELSVGGYLTPAAANSFERWRVLASRAGLNLTVTSVADAYRIYAVQERIFTDRYRTSYTEYAPGKVDKRYWNGQYWFRRPGTAAAAVPGTSNHGWAIAIDIANVGGFNSATYNWLSQTGPALGWTNDEGRSVGEAWHWKYTASNDSGGGGSVTPSPTPTPEEDDMFTDEDRAKVNYIFSAIAPGESGVRPLGHLLAAVLRAEAEAKAAKENTRPITRGGVEISLRQEIANIGTAVANLPTSVWSYKNVALDKVNDAFAFLRTAATK